MDKNLPSFEVFRPFAFIPKEIRIIELVVVCVLFLFSIRKVFEKERNVIYAIFIVGFIVSIGSVINSVGLKDSIQMLYVTLLPFILYIIFRSRGFDSLNIADVSKFYKFILIVNLPVTIYQFFVFRSQYPSSASDVVQGFFSDQHTAANFFFIFFLIFYAEYGAQKKISSLLFACAAFLMGKFGYNEKSTLFMGLIFLTMLIVKKELNFRTTAMIALLGIALFSISQYVASESSQEELRTEILTEIDLTEIGPVKSYINIPKVLSESSRLSVFWRWSGTIFQRNYFRKGRRRIAAAEVSGKVQSVICPSRIAFRKFGYCVSFGLDS